MQQKLLSLFCLITFICTTSLTQNSFAQSAAAQTAEKYKEKADEDIRSYSEILSQIEENLVKLKSGVQYQQDSKYVESSISASQILAVTSALVFTAMMIGTRSKSAVTSVEARKATAFAVGYYASIGTVGMNILNKFLSDDLDVKQITQNTALVLLDLQTLRNYANKDQKENIDSVIQQIQIVNLQTSQVELQILKQNIYELLSSLTLFGVLKLNSMEAGKSGVSAKYIGLGLTLEALTLIGANLSAFKVSDKKEILNSIDAALSAILDAQNALSTNAQGELN